MIVTDMADNEFPGVPIIPKTIETSTAPIEIPLQAGTSGTTTDDRDEYKFQLEEQLQDLRKELQLQKQVQATQPPVNEKLRFVTQWVPNEASQVQHFIGALLPEYRSTTRLAGNLSQAFTLAKSAEGDVKAQEKMNRDKTAL